MLEIVWLHCSSQWIDNPQATCSEDVTVLVMVWNNVLCTSLKLYHQNSSHVADIVLKNVIQPMR